MTPPLLVLHELAATQGAEPWRAAASSWPAAVIAPDLPGHAGAPAPRSGSYAPSDPALIAVRTLEEAAIAAAPVVLGEGWGGFAAELLAAAGRASAVVLVDGLGGPWRTPAELVAENHAWLRAIADDDSALSPASAGTVDPRLVHGFPSVWEQRFTEDRRRAVTVPVLAIETPLSSTPMDERTARMRAFAGPVTIEELPSRAPQAVLDVAREWISRET